MSADLLAWAGVAFASGGAGLATWAAASDRSSPRGAALAGRLAKVDADLRFVRATFSAEQLLFGQALGVMAAIALAWTLREIALLGLAALVVAAPLAWLARERTERVQRIEDQLDGWLLSLANALKSSPSLGDGLRTSADVTGGALGQEIDTVVKATMLGVPIDHALVEAGARIRSVLVSGALGALVVGRATGGDLPALLEKTAKSLREMHRLEGVLRAQTSSARAQANVMLAMPFVIVIVLQRLDASWFDPLSATPMGLLVTTIAVVLWVSAVLISRAVLQTGS